MKTITCPYDWCCGKTFSFSDLNNETQKFVQNSINNEMSHIFIECPFCHSGFEFNPITFKCKSMFQNPNTINDLQEEILNQLEQLLDFYPEAYLDFLKNNLAENQISIKNNKYTLYSLNELAKPVSIDGIEIIRAKELSIHYQTLLDILGENYFSKKNKNTIPSLLTEGLTIGHDNTNTLFLNKSDNSLWIFYPDGGDVEQTQLSIENIINQTI
jgi:hypothetical protein